MIVRNVSLISFIAAPPGSWFCGGDNYCDVGGLLSLVQQREVNAVAIEVGRICPRLVTAPGSFDLDDICHRLLEQQAAKRPGKQGAEIDNVDASGR